MPVMKIGEVWVPTHKRAMLMPVGVRLTGWSIRPMRVLTMFVMHVSMFMLYHVVRMLVAFRQVQP
jgi:hypothetical protein